MLQVPVTGLTVVLVFTVCCFAAVGFIHVRNTLSEKRHTCRCPICAGQYGVVRVLGQGSFGQVVLVRIEETGLELDDSDSDSSEASQPGGEDPGDRSPTTQAVSSRSRSPMHAAVNEGFDLGPPVAGLAPFGSGGAAGLQHVSLMPGNAPGGEEEAVMGGSQWGTAVLPDDLAAARLGLPSGSPLFIPGEGSRSPSTGGLVTPSNQGAASPPRLLPIDTGDGGDRSQLERSSSASAGASASSGGGSQSRGPTPHNSVVSSAQPAPHANQYVPGTPSPLSPKRPTPGVAISQTVSSKQPKHHQHHQGSALEDVLRLALRKNHPHSRLQEDVGVDAHWQHQRHQRRGLRLRRQRHRRGGKRSQSAVPSSRSREHMPADMQRVISAQPGPRHSTPCDSPEDTLRDTTPNSSTASGHEALAHPLSKLPAPIHAPASSAAVSSRSGRSGTAGVRLRSASAGGESPLAKNSEGEGAEKGGSRLDHDDCGATARRLVSVSSRHELQQESHRRAAAAARRYHQHGAPRASELLPRRSQDHSHRAATCGARQDGQGGPEKCEEDTSARRDSIDLPSSSSIGVRRSHSSTHLHGHTSTIRDSEGRQDGHGGAGDSSH